jgi:hypothetical protein
MCCTAKPASVTQDHTFFFHISLHISTGIMSSSDFFVDLEELEGFEESMNKDVGWVDSQQYPADRFEEEQLPTESPARYPGLQNPYDMEPDQNVTPAPLSSDGDPIDPFAAHDAGTCDCESLDQIRDSLKKTAARNRFELTSDQIKYHSEKIDGSQSHLYSLEQFEAQKLASITKSSRKLRGKCRHNQEFSLAKTYQVRCCPCWLPRPQMVL